MKFQNPSMHGSEVMLYIKKRNGRWHGRTYVPEAICPSNFFEDRGGGGGGGGGIITTMFVSTTWMFEYLSIMKKKKKSGKW